MLSSALAALNAQGWQGAFPKHLNFKSMSCVSECPQNESMKALRG